MEYDKDKVDETTLALLYLVMHGQAGEERAWKGFDRETMIRLHEKGYISDPRIKAKSVMMAGEKRQRARPAILHVGKTLNKQPLGVGSAMF
jgi:hypothetical protein